jgi:hypothetical protein
LANRLALQKSSGRSRYALAQATPSRPSFQLNNLCDSL